VIIQREMPGEVRSEIRDDGAPVLAGYTAVFNQWTDIGGMFREQIAPGAFAGVDGFDTVALFNHNSDNILGRLNAGTLRLSEDEHGLRYEVDVDTEDEVARRVVRKVERGELWGNSFAFTIKAQDWDEDEDGNLSRTVTRIDTLYDVGPVTYPAYEQTDVAVRELRALEEMVEAGVGVIEEAQIDDVLAAIGREQQDHAMRNMLFQRAARLRALLLRR
jgi:HK97 family phage prohead protease